MKNLIYLTIILSITSCASYIPYYQVYKTETSNNFTSNNNELYYEDENCIIYYDLWSVGGNLNFQFYNKTEDNISLHLNESFFILNGIAYDYFLNRTFSSSTGNGATISVNKTTMNNKPYLQGVSNTKSNTVSYIEQKIIIIPPKTAKNIYENYKINNGRFAHCDLKKYPSRAEKKSSLKFDDKTSPFKFSNRITYSINNDKKKAVEHKFYVNEIINYTKDEMFILKKDSICGKETTGTFKYFRDISNKDFYFKYIKS